MENTAAHLEISRTFNCSKESLYEAWTAPDKLKQWWRPMGKELVEVENNVTNGGTIKYHFDHYNLLVDGKYEEVRAHDYLKYSWNWHLENEFIEDAEYKLSVRFDGDDNHAELSITQQGFDSNEHIQPHRQGWEQALDQLGQFVDQHQQGGNADNSGNGKPPITGYNEMPEQEKVAGG